MTLLLPVMLLMRRLRRGAQFNPVSELKVSAPVNAACRALLIAERAAIEAGASLPVGGSLLAVARRPA